MVLVGEKGAAAKEVRENRIKLREARADVDVAWKEPAGDAPPGAN